MGERSGCGVQGSPMASSPRIGNNAGSDTKARTRTAAREAAPVIVADSIPGVRPPDPGPVEPPDPLRSRFIANYLLLHGPAAVFLWALSWGTLSNVQSVLLAALLLPPCLFLAGYVSPKAVHVVEALGKVVSQSIASLKNKKR